MKIYLHFNDWIASNKYTWCANDWIASKRYTLCALHNGGYKRWTKFGI